MNPKQRIHDKMVKLENLWTLVGKAHDEQGYDYDETLNAMCEVLDNLMADLKLDLYILEQGEN